MDLGGKALGSRISQSTGRYTTPLEEHYRNRGSSRPPDAYSRDQDKWMDVAHFLALERASPRSPNSWLRMLWNAQKPRVTMHSVVALRPRVPDPLDRAHLGDQRLLRRNVEHRQRHVRVACHLHLVRLGIPAESETGLDLVHLLGYLGQK